MALGANRANVMRTILRQALSTVVAGVILGLAATLVLARFMSGLLYEVRPENPVVLAAVSGLLILVALAASYVPAHRATTVDPLHALRSE